ncbi:nitric oxide reductase activation protein NorD [Zoogloea sp.]|uniref:nitric oxide reductase activation protein NorD n=1 Tax=Zoogloea sp. TaxID=49181 RepID=UPI0035B398BB
MEEWVGGLWHRFITRAAQRSYPEAAVQLRSLERTAGILFRALGGDPGLRVTAAAEQTHGARRFWLARLAHVDETLPLAGRDEETLRLPAEIALLPERSLNRDLYLWLIAQGAALADGEAGDAGDALDARWIQTNQQASLACLAAFPGFATRYQRLVDGILALRPDPARLPADEAAAEHAIRQALRAPGSVDQLPAARRPPYPVPVWLYPVPAALDRRSANRSDQARPAAPGQRTEDARAQRRQARREDMPDGRNGLILPFRAESLLSFAEYVKVNRSHDDDPDSDPARAAQGMDQISIAQDGQDTASRVRFDLDLPAAAQDDRPLASGILLPEWDWKRQQLLPDRCSLQVLEARDATPCALPERLRMPARRLRRQLEALTPARRWLKDQPEGSELDLDACVRAYTDRLSGYTSARQGGYRSCERRERDLCCLVLADLSLSTDAWVSNEQRVIDVIQDSLWLFSEAMGATGDPFALYGFSSRRRDHIRFHRIKGFDERAGDQVRGRIGALKPGFYTRMGAPIRYATQLLARRPEAVRLLLILSDGKPNDVDHYEGRYGIEDTRMSLQAARQAGVRPFCVTIDREGEGYLPHLFGTAGYTVLRRPAELPARLPQLYAQLTA